MEKKINFFKQHKYPFTIIVSILAIAFLWTFLVTFSTDTTDSARDGVGARDFTAGTGTDQNPHIMASAS